jgi:hypothetical protein
VRATRDWIPPASHTCPGCGKSKPTIGWHDACRDFPLAELEGQTTIYDELEEQ